MPDSSPPVVTFTTDFGTADFYVAAMKASLLRSCPMALPIDVTHAVPRHSILFGSIMIERALAAFAAGTIHVAVVDPGVGTHRKIIAAYWPVLRQTVICPDNGLITWAAARLGSPVAHELVWRPPEPPSNVFHGRDIMAPAAGLLANGTPIQELVGAQLSPVLLRVQPASSLRDDLVIVHIDHYGNATTNVPLEALAGSTTWTLVTGENQIVGVQRTYHDVPTGQPLMLIGSSGLLEIAVCEGSAAELLNLRPGDVFTLRQHGSPASMLASAARSGE